MTLLLAPFNNAMRLGQGFNSYTQQICVDDAVVIDPNRSENVITNDGTTMRIIAQSSMKPSAWNRQAEILLDNRAEDVLRRSKLLKDSEATANDSALKDENSSAAETSGDDLVESSEPAAEAENKVDPAKEEQSIDSKTDVKHGKTETSDTDSIEEIEHKELEDRNASKKDTSPVTEHKELTEESIKPPTQRTRASSVGGIVKKSSNLTALTKGSTSLEKAKQEKLTATRRATEKQATEEEDEKERLKEQRNHQLTLQKEAREEERKVREENRKEQEQVRAEKRQWDQERREQNRKAIASASDLKAISMQDLEKIKAQNQFADRFTGMAQDQQQYTFDLSGPRGPSQTVVYTSKFVDRLSDVTDDMNISGSLSIKAAKIGGSGRGSFIDSDKFKQSDLNFYISVKVINQTQNFKDALVFNPLRSVGENNFKEVYGDSFISGFLEGGEFNALVSMKIMNKAKMTDIKAEAKVAFTAGPVAIEAEANVGIARSNIETNTETTIQVSWCGGGHIKPPEQQWDIQSLMAAASRFPDLVADCPQRTYAILTKYDSLRSFIARKPATFSRYQYENAQIYTNALLDSFMSYKALYKKIGENIFQVQGKTMEILPWENVAQEGLVTADTKAAPPSMALTQKESKALTKHTNDLTRFEASLQGLSDARKAIRRQMMYIVNEVDLIDKDPKLATDDEHEEPFQSPVAFETRVPVAVVAARFRTKSQPLTGKRLQAKTQSEEEQKDEANREEELANATPLYKPTDALSDKEKETLDKILEQFPDIGGEMCVTSGVGQFDLGKEFNNLDFVKPDWQVKSFGIEVAKGAITYVEVWYENGLHLAKGKSLGGHKKIIGDFQPGERITSASLEYGVPSGDKDSESRLLSIRFFTNRGRRLVAQATKNEEKSSGTVEKDGVLYEYVKTQYFDSPLAGGTVKGFFGYAEESNPETAGIIRLGLIWGQVSDTSGANGAAQDHYDYAGIADNEDVQSLQDEVGQKRQEISQIKQQLSDIQKVTLLPKNNLSPLLDRKGVNIVHQGTLRAMDKGGMDKVIGFQFQPGNGNQTVILEKVRQDDPTSPWLILCDGTYLEFRNGGSGQIAYRSPRRTDGSAGCQEWWIGTNPSNSFLIENVQYGTGLTLNSNDSQSILSWDRFDDWGPQRFLIFKAA